MRNRLLIAVALGSLFLNIGVLSAVGFVFWQSQRGEEPWQTLEQSGWNDRDWAELDALLDKISANGLDSLNADEKRRLNDLSKRLR